MIGAAHMPARRSPQAVDSLSARRIIRSVVERGNRVGKRGTVGVVNQRRDRGGAAVDPDGGILLARFGYEQRVRRAVGQVGWTDVPLPKDRSVGLLPKFFDGG